MLAYSPIGALFVLLRGLLANAGIGLSAAGWLTGAVIVAILSIGIAASARDTRLVVLKAIAMVVGLVPWVRDEESFLIAAGIGGVLLGIVMRRPKAWSRTV